MSQVTSFTIQPVFSPIYPDNIFDIIQWCKDYPPFDKYPVPVERRFGIGFYQIHQCIEWKDNGVNKYESLAATVLHLTQCAVNLKYDPAIAFTEVKLSEFPKSYLDQKALSLLQHLSKAQQQIYYAVSKTKRAALRLDSQKLEFSLSFVIYLLICCIPIEFRSECFEKATSIIVKELK